MKFYSVINFLLLSSFLSACASLHGGTEAAKTDRRPAQENVQTAGSFKPGDIMILPDNFALKRDSATTASVESYRAFSDHCSIRLHDLMPGANELYGGMTAPNVTLKGPSQWRMTGARGGGLNEYRMIFISEQFPRYDISVSCFSKNTEINHLTAMGISFAPGGDNLILFPAKQSDQ